MEKGIKIKSIDEVEDLETSEGVMKLLIFGEKVAVIHLEIPAGLEVSPHAHSMEGVIYCLSGELEVISRSETMTVNSGTAMLVPPNVEIGIKNHGNTPVNAILISSPPPVKSAEELENLLLKIKEGAKQ
ncbi:cupin domain-containing protein [Methanophagales archaeon]|nr:MAG: cupin domain-containing protein [Methanophagales archaeon]